METWSDEYRLAAAVEQAQIAAEWMTAEIKNIVMNAEEEKGQQDRDGWCLGKAKVLDIRGGYLVRDTEKSWREVVRCPGRRESARDV